MLRSLAPQPCVARSRAAAMRAGLTPPPFRLLREKNCRRTGQLNHAAQNHANAKKRATPSDCAREMAGDKTARGGIKQPRVVA